MYCKELRPVLICHISTTNEPFSDLFQNEDQPRLLFLGVDYFKTTASLIQNFIFAIKSSSNFIKIMPFCAIHYQNMHGFRPCITHDVKLF